jgi:TonB family protein
MKKIIITSYLLLLVLPLLKAQPTSETKYFNDKYSSKEVPKEKAKYSQTITTNADSSITTEIRKIKTNEIITSQTYKGEEPFGTWKFVTSEGIEELDYNFRMNYSNTSCKDSISRGLIKDYFEDNDSLGYKAPKIANGDTSIYDALSRIVVYPQDAKERGISGTVYLNFNITKDGKIENISVSKSSNIYLDKETVRIFRTLKFSSPAYLNGKPINICVRFPFKYTLE